ncbi:MAG: response regulator [Nitrospira sp. CR1.3]|nr:response regulator [Nitrospira sp. CR1.3]
MPTAAMTGPTDVKPTVLIVDDEAAPRAALTQILRNNFQVLTAENARAAMAVLNDHGVDLVTLDLRLPDRSGAELLTEIKRAHAEIEVIMVTAYGTLQSAMDCIRQGAAGFLLKPFNATELLTISLQTTQKKQRLDMLREWLASDKDLWGPEPACTEAWHKLAAAYGSRFKQGILQNTDAGEPSPLLQLLSDLLEAKDRHLVNHGNRVSFYASLVANRMQLSLPEQNILSLGALAHDLDLIHIPAKPVLQQETDRSSHRTDLGARIGRALGLPADAVQIIALHHERWDGTGYPFGLQGQRIPLPARITTLAQAFDHLTAERSGTTPLTVKAALDEIERQAGTAFDPALTEIFCRAMREQPPQA